MKYREGRRTAWQLDVTDALSIRTFAREIGIFGKEAALARAVEAVEKKRYQTNRDLVPVGVWKRIEAAKGEESWSALARRAGIAGWTNVHAGKRAPTRDRLLAFADALGSEELRDLARSDVYWDEIVAIEPMGPKQVYDLTIPETHNFVANDICVHNTAFTLNITQHAAIAAQKPVAFFSLEMSKESLVQRILCAEARVDAGRLRRGRLSDDDYGRLAKAAGYLNTAPIYIDDTAGISVLEMRAKARRLKSDRPDLAMIVVDYLQLMTGGGKVENRQQEVSEISRNLKALAKELEVPVVALSQLSRAVESRPGQAADDVGPSRIGSHRAGRGRHHVPVPAGVLPRPGGQGGELHRGARRGHHRQAAQRGGGDDPADVPQGVHPLRELLGADGRASRGMMPTSRAVRPGRTHARPRCMKTPDPAPG